MMSKEARSFSLPGRPVLGGERMENVGVAVSMSSYKEKRSKRGNEKEKEIEGNFGVSSLCFKTDLMTVVQRNEMMERQKNIAEDNNGREIGYFSTVINDLTCLWQEPEVSEVLHRLARKAEELKLKTKKLAAASACLGSLRQELSYSKTVSVMVEYVDLLTERNADVHEQLNNAKKVLGDNNIAIEKPEEAVVVVTGKTRSLSLVSQPSNSLASTRRVSCKEGERSKSVSEAGGEILENSNGVRKKSRKCSMFVTISEHATKESVIDIKEYDEEEVVRRRKKSSKKVSIAENLNCDYSDSNVSDIEDENNLACGDVLEPESHNESNESNPILERIYKVMQSLVFHFALLVCYSVQYPRISVLILVLILFYFFVF